MKKTNLLLLIAFWIIVPLGLLEQTAFAGDSGSQEADWSVTRCPPEGCLEYCNNRFNGQTLQWEYNFRYINPRPPGCKLGARDSEKNSLRQFAAAQTRNENNRTPGGGLAGGETPTRFGFSFFASILVLLGGIWTLFVLLRDRVRKNRAAQQRPARVWSFALRPSAALAVFGLLFAAAIVGSLFTAPQKATAEKRQKPDKSKMVGATNPSNEPVFKSAQKIGGDSVTQIGAPVFDQAGNRYVRGGFQGDLKIGAATLAATSAFDLFFAKYAPDGSPLWARQGAGANGMYAMEGATAMAVDPAGNIYVGGSFAKRIVLPGGANPSRTLTDAGGSGFNYESFVAKYDANGNLLWAKGGNTGSPQAADNLDVGQNVVNQIVFDQSGNPYVSGLAAGNNFLGSATAVGGQTDILLAKLDPATGAVVWRHVIGGAKDDNGSDLKIDNSNNLYLIGNYGSAQITFPNGTTLTNSDDPNDQLSSSTNTFIAKFDSGGGNLWVENLDNSDLIGGSQIAVNGAGEIFLTGYFLDSAAFDDETLTETEGGGEDPESFGGYVAKMDTNGEFEWAEEFGGSGQGLALDAAGRIYIVGMFFDGGTFGFDSPNEETLASFGGQDIFVARYDANGKFDWAKPIAGAATAGAPLAALDSKENYYFPFGVAYNPASGTMFVSGDFQSAVALDCQTLTSAGEGNHQSYLAELSKDDEATSCRIWNGLDANDNNWDSTDNWNGGVLPAPGDSVYVPYTGNDFDPPTFNPATNVPLNNLAVADDRTLTLEQNLTVNGRLDLLGGFVDAESFPLLLGTAAQAFSINDGLVLGRVQKQFAVNNGGAAFTFPVGTAASDNSPEYSPVTLSNITGAGSFSVAANKGAYPNAATGLPANRAARWWNLTNNGLSKADLQFQYLAGDITAGKTSSYRAYRIPTGGGAATPLASSTNTATKTVTALNVTEFSDWTLASSRRALLTGNRSVEPE